MAGEESRAPGAGASGVQGEASGVQDVPRVLGELETSGVRGEQGASDVRGEQEMPGVSEVSRVSRAPGVFRESDMREAPGVTEASGVLGDVREASNLPEVSKVRIAALGDGAITVRFGETIDPEIYRMVRAFSSLLEERPFPAMTEFVAAYASVTVFYDVAAAAKLARGAGTTSKLEREVGAATTLADDAGPLSPYEWMRWQVESAVEQVQSRTPVLLSNSAAIPVTASTPASDLVSLPSPTSVSISPPSSTASTDPPQSAMSPVSSSTPGARTVDIPVCYGGEFGPDLDEVAELCGITTEEVIALHTGGEYLAYMIGFVPGFPYLGGLPDTLTVPRKAAPRLRVPAGSVGLAGQQTGIYPLASPGGWQIIGRTPIRLFTPERMPPTLLQAGDTVRFRAISREEYDRLAGELLS